MICPLLLSQTKLFLVYLAFNVADSVTYCRDLVTSVYVWNLDVELLLEVHDKLYDVK